MKDKICLITGANAGIGLETARALAQQKAHVIMLCRNQAKAEQAREDIIQTCGHDQVDIVLADLASAEQIKEAAAHINETYPKIDVLINNAGLLAGKERTTTHDGFETTFGVNHLAPFLLTHLLLDKVVASGRGNIINVASHAHRFGKLNFNNLQFQHGGYSAIKAYCLSKLCNLLFTLELSRRIEDLPVVTNALHPGGIASNFGTTSSGLGGIIMKLLRPFLKTPAQGAQTSVYLATSGEGYAVSGRYFNNKKMVSPSKEAISQYNAQRLWEISEDLLKIEFLSQPVVS